MPEPIGSQSADLQQLASDHVSGRLDADGKRRLAEAVERDPAARHALADQLIVDRLLRQAGAPAIDIERIMRAVPLGGRGAMQNRVLHLIESGAVPTYHAPRRGVRWPLAAAALLLITCSVALIVGLSRREPSADALISVASVRSGIGAVWSDGRPPTAPGSERIVGSRLDLRAGLAAITLVSGAELVIEGPTVIELTGTNQARLLIGRASAHVPPRASGFTLVAEGMTVVDRGTAFGLDQSVDGCAQLHVFAGAVEATARAQPAPLDLRAGSAVRLDARGGTLAPIPCEPTRFARSLRPLDLALDLVDLAAGGDGRGSAVADGIDPASGEVLSTPALGVVRGNGSYHRVTQAPAIDGVFVPLGDREQVITSAGHRYRFPPNDGQGYDLIRRGGTFDIAIHGGTPEHPGIPPVFGGVDYRQPGHAALGLHANCGITIDLATLTADHPGLRVERFTTRVANIGRKGGGRGRADFWILVDGVMASHYFSMTPDSGAEHVNLRIDPGTRFLTLIATDAGDRSGLDWITLGDPRLHLGSAP